MALQPVMVGPADRCPFRAWGACTIPMQLISKLAWYSWTENFATSTSRWDTGALPHDQTPAVDAAQFESSGKCAKQGSADIA